MPLATAITTIWVGSAQTMQPSPTPPPALPKTTSANTPTLTLEAGFTKNGVRYDLFTPTNDDGETPVVIIYAGLLVKPIPLRKISDELLNDPQTLYTSNYLGTFPGDLAQQLHAPVVVIYEPGVSGRYFRDNAFRRHIQKDATRQIAAGLQFAIDRQFSQRGTIIFSHSFSTIEHYKLDFSGDYAELKTQANVVGDIFSGLFTSTADAMNSRAIKIGQHEFNVWLRLFQAIQWLPIPLPINPLSQPQLHATPQENKPARQHGLAIWGNPTTAHYALKIDTSEIIQPSAEEIEIITLQGMGHNLFIAQGAARDKIFTALSAYVESCKNFPNAQRLVLISQDDRIFPAAKQAAVAASMYQP